MSSLQQWNKSSNWYDQNMGEQGDDMNHHLIFPALTKVLGDISEKTILDSGCGSGYFTAHLAQRAKKVIGTDFAESFIEICNKKYKNISNIVFQVHDVMKPMQFSNGEFEIVISKMVLQYVPMLDTFAHESKRVLVNGGQLLLAVDHPFNTQYYFAQAMAGKPNPKYPGLKDYFDHSEHKKLSLWGKVELSWYPKTIGDYIMPFTREGLILTDIIELPEEKNGVKIPRILILKFKK